MDVLSICKVQWIGSGQLVSEQQSRTWSWNCALMLIEWKLVSYLCMPSSSSCQDHGGASVRNHRRRGWRQGLEWKEWSPFVQPTTSPSATHSINTKTFTKRPGSHWTDERLMRSTISACWRDGDRWRGADVRSDHQLLLAECRLRLLRLPTQLKRQHQHRRPTVRTLELVSGARRIDQPWRSLDTVSRNGGKKRWDGDR